MIIDDDHRALTNNFAQSARLIYDRRRATALLMLATPPASPASSLPGPDYSQLDIAPTIALTLGLDLAVSDGRAVEPALAWGCRKAVLIIVDSLGYDLLLWLLAGLESIRSLLDRGHLYAARAVSNHTTPAIASILSGLTPEHHKILDKAGAKVSPVLSLPDIATAAGMRCAVIMEENGAEVYRGLIEIASGISDRIEPEEFDRQSCLLTVDALQKKPDLLVTYFIGIDRSVHLGRDLNGIRDAALLIDQCIGEVAKWTDEETLIIICGDHPIHAGPFKRSKAPYCVPLITARGAGKKAESKELSISLNVASGI